MSKYDVAAFIWPAYTGDEPRTRMFWPEGMGEWETVKLAMPKFPGHEWPRKPLWGYVNEADPAVMEMEIAQATRHGVNVFIYDWYWYDRRPFLENCLNDGFLKAANTNDMKFYLMWANHDANYLWDRRLAGSDVGNNVIWSGRVNRQDFEEMVIRLVDKYFGLENYYKIDGKPVFMLYDIPNFITGLGGVEEAREALEWFRQLAVSKGYPGVHLQFCARGDKAMNLSGVDGSSVASYSETLQQLDADSFSHYQFCQITDPTGPYPEVLARVKEKYEVAARDYAMPYFPQVSCGWDNNPRFPMNNIRPRMTTENTPENFEKGLRMAKEYVDTHELPAKLITINSWNEWTETSYLEPDDKYGYGYLEAIKKVFVDEA